MVLNKKCKNMDLTKMRTRKASVGSKGNNHKNGVFIEERPCLINNEWIDDFPSNCPNVKI